MIGNGELTQLSTRKNDVTGGWRVTFDLHPAGGDPVELRASAPRRQSAERDLGLSVDRMTRVAGEVGPRRHNLSEAAAALLGLPRVIGHRGAAGAAPENTLASIRKARELGASWVEFDVKLTRDGQAILFHDDDLERTTDGRGAVAATTLAKFDVWMPELVRRGVSR